MSLFNELKRRSVLRVAAGYVAVSWLVIQVVETLFPMFGLSEAAARGVVVGLAVGFIPALILAWAFELTPDGFRRDADADRAAPGMQQLGKRLDRIIIVLLVVAVGFFGFDKFVLDPARDAELEQVAEERGRTQALIGSYGTKSIAVLPFINMSSDPEQEYFSDGISEELLNLLAQIQDLRVISRSSAFSFKGKNIEIPEVAERLDVVHILEGSVRKSGNRIRITAQLIEATTDTHLWSQTYDRELEDIFDIQDEVAGLVVEALKVELLGDMPTAQRTDPLAHSLTLQARHLLIAGPSSAEKDERAAMLLQEALRIDPDYIPAMYYMGAYYYYVASFREPFDPAFFEENMRLNYEYDERALAVDPDHGKTLITLGWAAFEFEKDFQRAADLFERAVSVAPGDEEVLRVTSSFARRIGRFDTAIRLKQLAAERNPECSTCGQSWLLLLEAGRYEEALRVRLQYTGDGVSNYTLVLAALLSDNAESALDYADEEKLNAPDVHALRAMTLYSLGRSEEAQAELRLQVEEWGENDPSTTAMALAWMGDREAAFEMLYERYWPHMYGFHREVHRPSWVSLHDDPRWTELVEKSGYTEEAFAAIEFNPALPD
jgi:adenylate cyclase